MQTTKAKRLALTVALLALATALACLAGCGGTAAATPTDTVDAAMKALKAQDGETLAQYYSGDTSALSDPEKALESTGDQTVESIVGSAGELTDDQKAIAQKLVDKLMDFDYTLSNEKVDGDKATVDIEITTYDFGTAAQNFLTTYMGQAFAAAFSGETDQAQTTDLAFSLLDEAVAGLSDKSQVNKATLSLTKTDGTWKLDEIKDNQQFVDALLGGAVTQLSSWAESLGSMFSSGGDAGAAADGASSAAAA